jgi:tripartite-type tricarboxylate transporter receptor subunit TctC
MLMLQDGRALAAAGILSLFVTGAAGAQDWPNRTITMIVPFPAGGATDIVARKMAQELGTALGQTVIVENRPGAGATIGTTVAAQAEPDGHTLLIGTVGTHGINPSLYAQLAYDAVADFDPVILLQTTPNVVLVNNDLPVETMEDLVEYARANPGILNYASSGIGTSIHLAGEMFADATGLDMTHVPYPGSAQVLPAVMAGESQLVFDNMPPAYPFIQNGSLRAIAVTSPERSRALPDLPTVAESTSIPELSDFDATSWFAMFVPDGTPPEIIERLNTLSNEILSDPETAEFLSVGGASPGGGTPQELADRVTSEIERWAQVIEDAGIPKQ